MNAARLAIPCLILLATGAMVRPLAASTRWLTIGADAGAARYDDRLADYQWGVTPRRSWGAEALAGAGRFGLGARWSNNATTQQLDLSGVTDPRVSATRLEMVLRARLTSFAGIDVHALGTAGRQSLVYHPSQLEIPAGGGTPVTVELKPIHDWIAGGGVALSRVLVGPWGATFALERRWFALDTAHQSGGVVIDGRETFGMWDARVGVNWLATSR